MKKLLSMILVGMVVLVGALPVLWAVEGDTTATIGTGAKNTPQDVSDIEQTLKREKVDMLERRVADLEQANRFLSQRMQDLERTVYDFKSRT